MTGLGVDSRLLDGITIWSFHKNCGGKHPTYPTYPTSDGPSGQSGQSGQVSGQSLVKTEQPDPEDLEHDAVERLANQTEPEADPDDPSTYLDDSDFHLSPETREANRLLGEFPPQFDRRRKVSVRT